MSIAGWMTEEVLYDMHIRCEDQFSDEEKAMLLEWARSGY